MPPPPMILQNPHPLYDICMSVLEETPQIQLL